MRRTSIVLALSSLLAGLLAAVGLPTALAGDVGSAGAVSANVTGSGKVIAGGKAAWVEFVVQCPKGTSWFVEDGGFNFVATNGDQAPGRLEATSGKCNGSQQTVKIKWMPHAGSGKLVGPGCGDYSMTFRFSGGQENYLSWAPAGDGVTGPPVCLGSNNGHPVPSPSPTSPAPSPSPTS